MNEPNMLDKTNQMNLLFDFYGSLLTEKQRVFLRYYFYDDYSLGEIAEQFGISRQAIYEHLKRAEHVMLDYEAKLQLLHKHETRQRILEQMQAEAGRMPAEQQTVITDLIQQWMAIEQA